MPLKRPSDFHVDLTCTRRVDPIRPHPTRPTRTDPNRPAIDGGERHVRDGRARENGCENDRSRTTLRRKINTEKKHTFRYLHTSSWPSRCGRPRFRPGGGGGRRSFRQSVCGTRRDGGPLGCGAHNGPVVNVACVIRDRGRLIGTGKGREGAGGRGVAPQNRLARDTSMRGRRRRGESVARRGREGRTSGFRGSALPPAVSERPIAWRDAPCGRRGPDPFCDSLASTATTPCRPTSDGNGTASIPSSGRTTSGAA